jgi:Lhr-like helicase
MNKDEEALMRTAIKNFSNSRGFSKFTEAGMADYLRAKGYYVYSFVSPDESHISVNNVVNVKCYNIAIHSSISETTAQELGEQLRKTLGSTVSTEVNAESTCNATDKSPT